MTRSQADAPNRGELRLCAISFLFLCLPIPLFAAGWMRLLPCIVYLVVLVWLLIIVGARLQEVAPTPLVGLNSRQVGIILVAAFAWTAISGVGGIGYQTGDWAKHNAVLRDLIARPWPVWYSPDDLKHAGLDSAARPLVYYIAYYLPSAVVGKALGLWPANIFLWLQTTAAVACALAWFYLIAGRRRLLACLLIFILLSGADALGHLLTGQPPASWFGHHLEWWSNVQYSSMSSALFWVPQHMTAAWLGIGLLWLANRTGCWEVAVSVVAFAVLWSPFVAVGLAPFAAWVVWRRWRPSRRNLAVLAAAGAIAVPLAGYILAYSEFTTPASTSGRLGLWSYVKFAGLEWAVAAVLGLIAARRRLDPIVTFFWIACLSLLVIPIVPTPGYRDFVMRASLPALFLLAAILTSIALDETRRTVRIIWLALFLVGALTPATEIIRGLVRFDLGTDRWPHGSLAQVEPDWVARQYMGWPDAAIWRTLLRPAP